MSHVRTSDVDPTVRPPHPLEWVTVFDLLHPEGTDHAHGWAMEQRPMLPDILGVIC